MEPNEKPVEVPASKPPPEVADKLPFCAIQIEPHEVNHPQPAAKDWRTRYGTIVRPEIPARGRRPAQPALVMPEWRHNAAAVLKKFEAVGHMLTKDEYEGALKDVGNVAIHGGHSHSEESSKVSTIDDVKPAEKSKSNEEGNQP